MTSNHLNHIATTAATTTNPSFFQRNKKKIAILTCATLLVGGGTAAATVGYYKYHQHTAQLEEQRRLMSHRMRYLYEENRKTAEIALRSLLPKISEKLRLELLPVEDLMSQLKVLQQSTMSSSMSSSISSSFSKDEDPANSGEMGEVSTADQKKKLWEQIKIDSFARTIAAVYSISLLHLFLSVQVNIIGRRLFLKHRVEKEEKERLQKIEELEQSGWMKRMWHYWVLKDVNNVNTSVASKDADGDDEQMILDLTENVQHLFLCQVGHFEKHGLEALVDLVQSVVNHHMKDVSLKQLMTPNDMFHLIESIRGDIENSILSRQPSPVSSPQYNHDDSSPLLFNHHSMSSIMLPPECEEADLSVLNGYDCQATPQEKDVLKILMDELRDILESEDYVNVFREASNGAFSVLHKRLEEIIISSHKQQTKKTTTDSATENIVKIHLASIVTKLVKEVKSITDNNEENEYVWSVHENMMLNKYCVIVYSSGVILE